MHGLASFVFCACRLARTVSQKVHSFDLVAANEYVTACDIANVSDLLASRMFTNVANMVLGTPER